MVLVRYYRPGKDTREWNQRLLADTEEMIVSSFIFRLQKPFSFNDDILIKDGYFGIMFDLFNTWYNVVKVFDKGKNFVGYYSDIRTPPKRISEGYEAKDLFLDFWIYPGNTYLILDKEEFQKADLKDETRNKVKKVVEKLKSMIEGGNYPPKKINKFDLGADEIRGFENF